MDEQIEKHHALKVELSSLYYFIRNDILGDAESREDDTEHIDDENSCEEEIDFNSDDDIEETYESDYCEYIDEYLDDETFNEYDYENDNYVMSIAMVVDFLFDKSINSKKQIELIRHIVLVCHLDSTINNIDYDIDFKQLFDIPYNECIKKISSNHLLSGNLIAHYFTIIFDNERYKLVFNSLNDNIVSSKPFFRDLDTVFAPTLNELYDHYFNKFIDLNKLLSSGNSNIIFLLNEQITNTQSFLIPTFIFKDFNNFFKFMPKFYKKLLLNTLCVYNYLNHLSQLSEDDKKDLLVLENYFDEGLYYEAYSKMYKLLLDKYIFYLNNRKLVLNPANNVSEYIMKRRNIDIINFREIVARKN